MPLNISANESTASSRPILRDDDNSWSKVPYQVYFGENFQTMADSVRYLIECNTSGTPRGASQPIPTKFNADIWQETLGIPAYFSRSYFRDTRLGANDAINCIWQFNRDDDIVHPLTQSEVNGIGEGRVYAATTETNQSFAWFTFGVPRFTDFTEFFLNAANDKVVSMNNTGFSEEFSLGYIFGVAVETTFALAFTLPILAGTFFMKVVNMVTDYTNPSDRFYNLRPTMHLYYKYVDSILAEWLVATGLYGNGASESNPNMEQSRGTDVQTGYGVVDAGGEKGDKFNSWTADPDSLPIALVETGPSIWQILGRKAMMMNTDTNNNKASAKEFEEKVNKLLGMDADEYDWSDQCREWSGNCWSDFKEVTKATAFGATQFVCFRIEKSVDANESFNNSTGPSEVAEKINSWARSANSVRYSYTGLKNEVSDSFIGGMLSSVSDLMKGFAEQVGISGISSAVMGGAIMEVPEQYQSSDFSKAHSLNFQLRAPYGDITSIYQSIMVPLAMLMAAVLPHAAGPNSYTQPFLCRVYSKGLFSIPMGIIDSLSIKRGSSEFGWTYQNLPTCIDVSITIKDLSPAMYMPIAADTLTNIFATDSSFKEYLLTLAGVGLFERVSRLSMIRRNAQVTLHKLRNRVTNSMYWGNLFGDSRVARGIASVLPFNRISHDQYFDQYFVTTEHVNIVQKCNPICLQE